MFGRRERSGEQLAIKERVVATRPMPGIPEGTPGNVILVEGLTWIRYWVRFENGIVRGTLDRKVLARPSEWTEILRRREAGEDVEDEAATTATPDADGETAAAAGGESVMVNGVAVPAHLIDRAKKRREALGLA